MSGGDVLWNAVSVLLPLSSLGVKESRHNLTVYETSSGLTADNYQTLFGLNTLHIAYSDSRTSAPTGREDNGTMLRVATSWDFDLGTGDFTIEAWFFGDSGMDMPNDSGVDEYLPHTIWERANTGNPGNLSLHLSVYRIQDPPYPDKRFEKLEFFCGDYSTSLPMLSYQKPAGANISGQWYHAAITRNGNQWTMWLAGVPVSTATATTAISSILGDMRVANSIFDTSNLGYGQPKGRAWAGNIAQVRVTKGFARYTVDFSAEISGGKFTAWPLAGNDGDYTTVGTTGPKGADATGDAIPGPPGEAGEPGGGGALLAPPPPGRAYDQANENQWRRAVEAAFRG